MEQTIAIVAIVFSIIVPILIFIIGLRPFIKDTVNAEVSEFKLNVERRVSNLEGRFQEWAPIINKLVPDLLKQISSNPDSRRAELLEKWKAGTLNYKESIELRDILAREADEAEQARKTLIALGLLALFIYALSKE